MNRFKRFAAAFLQSSIVWGSLAALGFFALIESGVLENGILGNDFFRRYFAGHWVEYVETTMFFIALAQIILKAGELTEQRAKLKKNIFDQTFPLGDAEAEARTMLAKLGDLPEAEQKTYLPTRLRNALEGVCRKGSADGLEDDLRFLSVNQHGHPGSRQSARAIPLKDKQRFITEHASILLLLDSVASPVSW